MSRFWNGQCGLEEDHVSGSIDDSSKHPILAFLLAVDGCNEEEKALFV